MGKFLSLPVFKMKTVFQRTETLFPFQADSCYSCIRYSRTKLYLSPVTLKVWRMEWATGCGRHIWLPRRLLFHPTTLHCQHICYFCPKRFSHYLVLIEIASFTFHGKRLHTSLYEPSTCKFPILCWFSSGFYTCALLGLHATYSALHPSLLPQNEVLRYSRNADIMISNYFFQILCNMHYGE